MRLTKNLFAAAVVGAFVVIPVTQMPAFAADTSVEAKKADCDEQRKACLASKAQTGTYGERYVPPEAVKECQEAHNVCMAKK